MGEATTGTFSQDPAPSSLGTMIQRVSNYVLAPYDGDVALIATEAVNESILNLNIRNWSWSRRSENIDLVADTQEYALPVNFKAVRTMEILDASTPPAVSGKLDYLDPKLFDEVYFDRGSPGSPSVFTVFSEFENGMLTLSCPASADFVLIHPTLRLRYYSRLPILSATSDTIPAPSDVENYVVWYARASVAAHWVPAKVAFAEARAEKAWRNLLLADVRKEVSGW